MGRYRDEAPIGNTCPIIDHAIDQINCMDLQEEEEPLRDSALAQLELIRKANEILRTWGNEMHEERAEFEKDLEKAQDTIKDLEREIIDFKEQLKELETELEETEEARSDAIAELENLQTA